MSMLLLQELIEAFSQADPESEFYHEEINGCEAVNFLSKFIPDVRNYLDELQSGSHRPDGRNGSTERERVVGLQAGIGGK